MKLRAFLATVLTTVLTISITGRLLAQDAAVPADPAVAAPADATTAAPADATAAPAVVPDPTATTSAAPATVESDLTPTVTVDPAAVAQAGGILAGIGLTVMLITLLPTLLIVVAFWRILSKAGLPGFGILIPIWNLILLCQAAGKSGWLVLLNLIPGLGTVIFMLLVSLGIATRFGKGAGFGIGLWLLPIIFAPILGFGSATVDGMELPDISTVADGGLATRATAPGMPPVIVRSGSYTVAVVFGVIAVLCFIALLLFQWLEYDYFKSFDPRHGMGSVWPTQTK